MGGSLERGGIDAVMCGWWHLGGLVGGGEVRVVIGGLSAYGDVVSGEMWREGCDGTDVGGVLSGELLVVDGGWM